MLFLYILFSEKHK